MTKISEDQNSSLTDEDSVSLGSDDLYPKSPKVIENHKTPKVPYMSKIEQEFIRKQGISTNIGYMDNLKESN